MTHTQRQWCVFDADGEILGGTPRLPHRRFSRFFVSFNGYGAFVEWIRGGKRYAEITSSKFVSFKGKNIGDIPHKRIRQSKSETCDFFAPASATEPR